MASPSFENCAQCSGPSSQKALSGPAQQGVKRVQQHLGLDWAFGLTCCGCIHRLANLCQQGECLWERILHLAQMSSPLADLWGTEKPLYESEHLSGTSVRQWVWRSVPALVCWFLYEFLQLFRVHSECWWWFCHVPMTGDHNLIKENKPYEWCRCHAA